MKRLNALLLAALLISSCAPARAQQSSLRPPEKPDAPKPQANHTMDRKYFAVMGVLAAAKAADAFTTSEAVWPCREKNPILGPNPSNGRIAGFAAISLAVEGGTALLLKRFGERHRWARYLWVGEPSFQALRHAQAAMHDASLNCRSK